LSHDSETGADFCQFVTLMPLWAIPGLREYVEQSQRYRNDASYDPSRSAGFDIVETPLAQGLH